MKKSAMGLMKDDEAPAKRRCWARDKEASELRLTIDELSLVKPEEKKISTVAFLTVSNLLLQVLDKIGPTMAVLRQDVRCNIQRLEDFYVSDPLKYANMGEMLKKEVDGGTARKADSCARAVVWLTRSMDFSLALFQRLEKDSEIGLQQAVEESYNSTLKPWHGWISAAAYKVALKLVPEREIFTGLLMSQGQDYHVLKRDVQSLISVLQPFLNEIHSLLRAFHLDRLKAI